MPAPQTRGPVKGLPQRGSSSDVHCTRLPPEPQEPPALARQPPPGPPLLPSQHSEASVLGSVSLTRLQVTPLCRSLSRWRFLSLGVRGSPGQRRLGGQCCDGLGDHLAEAQPWGRGAALRSGDGDLDRCFRTLGLEEVGPENRVLGWPRAMVARRHGPPESASK